MKKRILGSLAFLLSLVLIINLGLTVPVEAADTSEMGQLIDEFSTNNSVFTLSEDSRFYIVSDTEPDAALTQTVQLVQRQFAADNRPSGAVMDIVWGKEDWVRSGDIVIRLDAGSGIGAEGYQLEVTTTVEITASDVDGLLYGLNMLLKHFRNAGENSIKGFTAADAPDTKQRVVSLDCGRKYYTKDWICNFIREMSWMGYNTLQFHFSDDSGFRFDLWDKKYYEGQFQPANDFSWVCGGHYTSWTLEDYQDYEDRQKYLTTAEVIEILNTAKEYHIDVIPSFDSPAHMDYLTWKFEQNYLANTDYSFESTYYFDESTGENKTYYAKDVNGCINYMSTTGYSAPAWPNYAAFDINSEQASAFVFELYIDIANFFKEYAGSTDFSIGADEVNLSYDPNWGYSDFIDYVNELNGLLNDMGYTMRMYNDFVGSYNYNYSSSTNQRIYTFDSNIEIMYWNSDFNPNTGKWTEDPWHVAFFWADGTNGGDTGIVTDWGDGNRTIYNCIQTHTYYALRITEGGSDARSEKNRQWTFYHATEEKIFDEWYPANISEIGDYEENAADVPDEYLGGAYFLIWCDYACVSTEAEIWNGVYDKTTQNTGEFYSLRDRMWSNTIKMWNSDINLSSNSQGAMTYSQYKELREKFGTFPGVTTCSAAADLPAAGAVSSAEVADHTALRAALAKKLRSQHYTAESYAAYETAYAAAVTVDNTVDATQDQVDQALADLIAAENALVIQGYTVTIACKAMVNGGAVTLDTIAAGTGNSFDYSIALDGIAGYAVDYVVGSTFVAGDADNVTGTLQGTTMQDLYVEVWYKSILDTAFLNDLMENAITAQGSYTSDSWTAYQTALANARSFTPDTTTRQSDVDALAQALSAARTALVVAAPQTAITVEKLTANAYLGKQVGLRITTTPDVASLTVTDQASGNAEALTMCTAQVQTLDNGETVKVWLIYFPADQTGTVTYVISGGDASAEVKITVV